MKSSALRPRLAAILTAALVCLCLLALSSAPAWAKAGTIREFPIPTANSQPARITAGPDGNLWFTEESGNKIGRITTSGTITEFPIPTPYCLPNGITTLSPARLHGNLWFTEFDGNKIGRIS